MNNDTSLMVSICCITYNHAKFVGQAIESFLMQHTDFEFDIVIGDDCSTDNTMEILESYRDKYPGRITLISTPRNMGTITNLIGCIALCKGKYIALCEGDDYWTDPYKLQKQVDFLEANPDYVMCCHYTRVVNESNSETLYVHPNPVPLVHSYYDLLSGKQEETKTATVVYRNLPEIHSLFGESWFFTCNAGDKFFKLFATQVTGQKIYVIPEVMSCYRNHPGGVWSMINAKIRMNKMISDFDLIIKNFSYPALMKKKLLRLYAKKYLLFELRQMELRNVFNTIKYLM